MKIINKSLAVGDVIKCYNKEDLIEIHEILQKEGFQTDFVYEHNGKSGYWLLIKGKE